MGKTAEEPQVGQDKTEMSRKISINIPTKRMKMRRILVISLSTLKASPSMAKRRREKPYILTRMNVIITCFSSEPDFIPNFRALQEAQDIFGVDFDYEDFQQEGEEYEEDEEEEEYEDEEGVRKTRKKPGQVVKKKSQRKTIYDVYEPSELERGHFTDFDEKVGLIFSLTNSN